MKTRSGPRKNRRPMSRADEHDRDKLLRWWGEIQTEIGTPFPFHAVLLVTESDHAAHEVFRTFREWLKPRGAPFSSLVIFGQHGASTTMRALAQAFALDGSLPPYLLLFESYSDRSVVCYPADSINHRSFQLPDPQPSPAHGCNLQSVTSLNAGWSKINLTNETVLELINGVVARIASPADES